MEHCVVAKPSRWFILFIEDRIMRKKCVKGDNAYEIDKTK